MEKIIENTNRFKQLIEANSNIRKNTNDWSDFLELSDSAINRAVKRIEKYAGIVLAPEFYKLNLFSGYKICWHYEKDEFIYGGFRINGISEALALKSEFWKVDFSLASDQEVPEELKHFEKLNWFEKQAWGDDWRFGCFIRDKGVFPPQIAFFDRNWYVPMPLSLEEYFDAMFASCAVKGWQYFYVDIDNDFPHLEKALEDMEKAIRLLPKIFPNMDFSYHINKLDLVKGKL